jgi:hypothetical protein
VWKAVTPEFVAGLAILGIAALLPVAVKHYVSRHRRILDSDRSHDH